MDGWRSVRVFAPALYSQMVAVSVKEKSSLSFSNSERQMFLYRLYVK